MVKVRLNRICKNQLFEVTAFSDKVFHGSPVIDSGDVLGNDWPLIQVSGRIMGRGTDDFYPVCVRLMIRLATGERGQEAMVDVDHGGAEAFKEIRAQDLHVAGHHHEFYPVAVQDLELLSL